MDPVRKPAPRFVIWAPSYDENSGGVIALHALCSRLNELGWQAKIWPGYLTPFWRRVAHLLTFNILRKVHKRWMYDLGPFKNKFASKSDIGNSIIIYPEIVTGNPLRAKCVVRWILYYPIDGNKPIENNNNELIIPYLREFVSGNKSAEDVGTLRITYINRIYRQINFSDRHGSCFLVYKGKNRKLDRHPNDAISIDLLNHEEKFKLFNQVKYLYTYDLYSFYNIYAALCGCVPIVIPENGVSREQWYHDEERRFGLAYGVDDVPWAVSTRSRLIEELAKSRAEEDDCVRDFVELCLRHFLVA